MRGKYVYPLSLGGLVLLLDLVTKEMVVNSMQLYESIPVIDGLFNLVHVLNRGAAFGFLSDASITWQTGLFIGVAIFAIGIIFYMLKTGFATDRFATTGLGLILGGALGNLIDRIRTGFVVDFLDFYFGNYHWPAFNVADIGICVGVGCLLVSFYLTERRERAEASKAKKTEEA